MMVGVAANRPVRAAAGARCLSNRCVINTGVLLVLLARADALLMAQTLTQRLKSEPVDKLAVDARQKGSAVRGAVLLTKQTLSCTRCHVPAAAKPVGPDLNALGKDATDVYLVEALLDPSKVIKKGYEAVTVVTTAGKTLSGRIVDESPARIVLQVATGDLPRVTLDRSAIDEIAPSKVSAMPDNLVDQLASRDQFLDLVRYLMELAAAGAARPAPVLSSGGQTVGPELQGMVLLKEFNCGACHHDDVTKTPLAAKQPPELSRTVGRIAPEFLRQFVADPLHTRPGTTMPDVMGKLAVDERRKAADEIAHYLASLAGRQFSAQPVEPAATARGRDLFHTVGCVACHSPRDSSQRELLPDSSVPLGSVERKYDLTGLVAFLENPLESRPSGRMPKMQLSHWEAIDLASYLLGHARDDGHDLRAPQPVQPDQELVAKGKSRFGQLGCRQCHRVDTSDVKPTSLPLSKVRSDRGCLSTESGNWPKFGFTDAQRNSIHAALKSEPRQLTEDEQIAVTLTAFRCLNCHQRDELGGVSAERDPHFQTSNPNLGPQGRIPPTLTGVGAKLNPAWLRQVLASGRTIRPYVLTRMPQFGADNVAPLVELFDHADRVPPVEFAAVKDPKELRKIGTEMIGTGGLSCIVCHTFQLTQAVNMPGVDLTEMAERLRKDWFFRYMRDPQRLSPNTIMPSFWPGGRALRQDLLEGNRDLQIEALWQYLLEGRQAPTPRGLVLEPLELLATDEAVLLRRSYPGIGKRGIGVGYPQQVNLAFDAEQLRWAMIWKGKFADPAGVWRSQGHGNVRPLGDELIRFAPGPDLDQVATPSKVDDGRPPHHQFQGYSLDDRMRPRFKYQFAGIGVEDYSVDVLDPATGKPFLRRTVTLKADSSHKGLRFRAATGRRLCAATMASF